MSRRETAYHEASHAVIGLVEGCPLVDVEIHEPPSGGWQRGDERGVTRFVPLADGPADFREIEARIITALAGMYGTARASRCNSTVAMLRGGQSDVDYARELFECVKSHPATHSLDHYANSARELVRENWHAIERVAAALLEHRVLDAATVVELAGLEGAA